MEKEEIAKNKGKNGKEQKRWRNVEITGNDNIKAETTTSCDNKQEK